MLWIPPLLYLALTGLEISDATPRVGSRRHDDPRTRVLGDCGSIRASEVEWRRGSRSVCPFAAGVRYRLLLKGNFNGDFIFNVRKLDPQKQHMVAREKQIVVNDQLGWWPREILHTQAEALDFFRTWGIRYAVVEDQDPWHEFGSVRELLNSDQFELLRTFPVSTNQHTQTHQNSSFPLLRRTASYTAGRRDPDDDHP